MTTLSLPEIKDSSGRVLLPAAELVLQQPELTEVKQRLIDKGLLSPPEPRWVTPRTGQAYAPRQWQDDKVHWHCFRSQGDPAPSDGTKPKSWDDDSPNPELVARTPEEALVWLSERLAADANRVPEQWRDRDDPEWHTEFRWVRLCLGRTMTAAHRVDAHTQLRYHVNAVGPADCQRH